jgi:hypothetical protein
MGAARFWVVFTGTNFMPVEPLEGIWARAGAAEQTANAAAAMIKVHARIIPPLGLRRPVATESGQDFAAGEITIHAFSVKDFSSGIPITPSAHVKSAKDGQSGITADIE